jgi:hypothetical protein
MRRSARKSGNSTKQVGLTTARRSCCPGVKKEHFDAFLEHIMEQAEAIYAQWPPTA